MVGETQKFPAKRGIGAKHILGVLIELIINVALPALIYVATKAHVGDVQALMLASCPAIVWSVVMFIRERRLDAISLLVLAGIVMSLIGFIGGGGVQFLQLRENLVTGLVGLIFLGSVVIGRPLILHLARAGTRRVSPAALDSFDALGQDQRFRDAMTSATLIWALGLVAVSAINCALVFVLSIEAFLLVSGPISYGMIGLLTAFTYWHVPKAIKAARMRLAPAVKSVASS